MRSSRLAGEPFTSPAEAVGWHLAMQSQDYAPASWSIGQRSKGLAAADVDRALADGSIVRTHVLRPTWHFVAREDIRWLLALSGPRVQQTVRRRYGQLGLDARALARAEKVIVKALSGGNRLTRNELGEVLDRARFEREGQRMPWVLMHLELEAVIGSGGLDGKQQTYALLDDRVPAAPARDRDDALVELVRRYLQSHGPATLKDMSWWSGLTIADLKRAIELLGAEVRSETLEGLALWTLASDDRSPPANERVHLLQTYDELVVGYTESRFFGDPAAERARAAWGDRTFPSGLMLFGGRVAGHWRRRAEGTQLRVEVHAYDPRRRGLPAKVDAAAHELGAFFGRPVTLEMAQV